MTGLDSRQSGEIEQHSRAKPAHGTQEWAKSNVNIQKGCEHDCAYCYAKERACQFRRTTPQTWKDPVIKEAALDEDYSKRDGRIMFPSTHDITPRNLDACAQVLKSILKSGNDVLIVSKPHRACVKRLRCELAEYRNQITFRFTIGSADDAVLKLWEPGAPAFEERLASLEHAYEKGFETSVSCEPMLDANIDTVITLVEPYVTDTIWLGLANGLRHALALNRPGNAGIRRHADELIAIWDDDAIRELYELYKGHSLIRWKDSVKKVVGLERPTEKGLDV
jgi:DNA repair photolyase